MMKIKKLSWKLTLIYATIFSVVLILLNVVIIYGVNFFIIQQSVQKVESISESVKSLIIGTEKEQMTLDDEEILYDANNDKTINIIIADKFCNIINESGNFKTTPISAEDSNKKTRKLTNGENNFTAKTTKIVNRDDIVYIQVAQNLEKENKFLQILLYIILLTDFIGISFSLLAGYIVSKRMLNPIDKITKTVKEIEATDLETRIEIPQVDDELSRLAKTFNEMLDRIKLAFDKQGCFVADASHELRTPISVITGYIGIVDRWGKDNPAVLAESITAIKNETVNMTTLIEKLLFLARGDMQKQLLQKIRFSTGELLDEIKSESNIISANHIFIYENTITEDFFADRKMIKQMLRAIIDNSIKYSAEQTVIKLLCYKKDENIVFAVSDNGIGIPNDEKDKIFDRFYRVDKARARETGGSGLGLSIVKWIVDAHNGIIKVHSKVGVGTEIIIFLPI